MKTILITGGAGFIGSNLIPRLLNAGDQVLCLDNLITGSMKNIEAFLNHPNFLFIEHDICSPIPIPSSLCIDQIYHLASIASPEKYKKYPIETLETSINGTQQILEICKQHNARLLFTSTSEVYGDPLVHPQPEEYFGNVNPIGERSCYDEGKRVCETLLYEYRKAYNLDLKIVRLFNTYGPKMDINDGRVITNFIDKIIKNEPIEIYGDGNQTRSFCYIDDMIDALILMMNSNHQGPINLGNPHCEFTLNRLAQIFETIIQEPLCKIYLNSTQDDPKMRKPVIEKATQYLGWRPKIGLEEGLKKTMAYFMNDGQK